MIINKITHGYVIQTWDTDTKRWVDQEFVAGNQVKYEEAGTGGVLDPVKVWPDTPEPYLPFVMQPVDATEQIR